ncbi:MAG: hypothetical protein JWO51_961 [Rhodospirillales bacterium]|nr:hypothetical protein [Rhodospirillales bacterium]
MLRVERLADPDAFKPLVPQWEAIEKTLSPRVPFTMPLWNFLWWQHLSEHRRPLSDEFHSFAVYSAQGALVAIAPMMLTHRPASGPLRVRKLQFLGADPFITEVRGLICAPANQFEATVAIIEHLYAHRQDWDWVEWFGALGPAVPDDYTAHGFAFERVYQVPDHYLPLPDSWEALRSRFPPNTKEALRKCYRSLSRDGHAFTLRTTDRPADVPAAMATFFRLHTARAASPAGARHPDLFQRRKPRAFLNDLIEQAALRRRLRIYELLVDGDVVATRIAFEFEREIYLYYSGFDPAWSNHNVMTTLMAEIMKWAIERGFAILNLSTGTDRSKTRWRPDAAVSWVGTLVSPTWRGRTAHFAYEDILARNLAPSLPTIAALARRWKA